MNAAAPITGKVLKQKISDRELWKLIRKHKDAAKEILQVSDIVLYVKDKNGKRIKVKSGSRCTGDENSCKAYCFPPRRLPM